MSTGQLFSRTTQALFYNYKQSPVQRMLDFDFLCGKSPYCILQLSVCVVLCCVGIQKYTFAQTLPSTSQDIHSQMFSLRD
jgi:hypothetical protein